MPKAMDKDPHMSDDDCYIVEEDVYIVEDDVYIVEVETPETSPPTCSKKSPVRRAKKDFEERGEKEKEENVSSSSAATTVDIELLQMKLAKAEADILKWKTLFFKAEAEKNELDEKLYSEKEKTMKLKNDLAIEKEEVEKFKEEATEIRVMAESQLQCPVCSEVIVGATTINCGHTFCEFCLHEWQKKKSNCPLCRTDIKHKVAVRILDEFTDKLYQQLTNEDGLEERASLKLRRDLESRGVRVGLF